MDTTQFKYRVSTYHGEFMSLHYVMAYTPANDEEWYLVGEPYFLRDEAEAVAARLTEHDDPVDEVPQSVLLANDVYWGR